jgi:Suppressor of fused protein (SUFU)
VLHEKVSVHVHVDIYMYGASPTRPYITLATSGMAAADVPRDGSEHGHPAELVTYVPHDWDFSSTEAMWLTRRLIEVVRFPHESQEVISKHHTWCVYDDETNVADALFPGSLLTHWYFRSLIHESAEIDHLVLPSGRHVNFMWAYPITRNELYFATQADEPYELEVQLATYAETPIDVHRQCLVEPENRQARRARIKEQKRLARTLPIVPWMTVKCDYHHPASGDTDARQ